MLAHAPVETPGPLIAKALDDVHVQYVRRFLRAQKIDLSERKSWRQSNPEFAAKAEDTADCRLPTLPPHPRLRVTMSRTSGDSEGWAAIRLSIASA
jgi:hypothetical protein